MGLVVFSIVNLTNVVNKYPLYDLELKYNCIHRADILVTEKV